MILMLPFRLQQLAIFCLLHIVVFAPTPLHSALFSEASEQNDLSDCVFVVNIEGERHACG